MDKILKNIRHRTELVLGSQALGLLANSRVIIFGLGGVGSWCAESLVRSGLMNLTIVDSDIICATNINRQLQATSESVGRAKVEELAARLRLINPSATVIAVNRAFEDGSWQSFGLENFDYVIDAIDSLRNKILLADKAQAAGATFFASMGAAAKIDPSRIRVDTLEKTQVCPLAKHVRLKLRELGIPTSFLCVYSYERPREPLVASFCGTDACTCTADRAAWANDTGLPAIDWCKKKRQVNGSLVHITAVFGFMLAGLVVQDVCRRTEQAAHAARI